jgi:DNA polymerase III epsilon subunit-like protein
MRLLGQAPVHGFADEASLLTALREFLNSRGGPDTILAGHNVAGFDLPRLRLAFLRYGLQLPAVLADEQPTFDTLKVFARRFYGDGAAFLGLGEVCELVGIPNHKGVCNGADVPALVAAGRVDELVTYNFVDAVLQAELFLRLSGRSTQLK